MPVDTDINSSVFGCSLWVDEGRRSLYTYGVCIHHRELSSTLLTLVPEVERLVAERRFQEAVRQFDILFLLHIINACYIPPDNRKADTGSGVTIQTE